MNRVTSFEASCPVTNSRSKEGDSGMFIAKAMLRFTNKIVRLQSSGKLTMNIPFHHLNNNGGEADGTIVRALEGMCLSPFHELEQH